MRRYFYFLALFAVIALPLMLPVVVIYVVVATLGFGLLAVIGIVNCFVLSVLLVPAVWLGARSKYAGAIATVVIVAGILFGPALVREVTRESIPLFAAQVAVTGPQTRSIRSIEFDMLVQQRKIGYTCSTTCLRLMQNEAIDFVRLKYLDGTTRVFERTALGMVPVADPARPVDVVITDYDDGAWGEPDLPMFWFQRSGLDGYVIKDNRTGTILAQNCSAPAMLLS